MGVPPPAFTIRNPRNVLSDNVTPFRDYDYFGPLWDPVPFSSSSSSSSSSKQTVEEWTTNEFITFEQLEEYGGYYVGDRSDMYAVSHLVYYVEGQYMPVFRKITGNDMFTDSRWIRFMRLMAKENQGAGFTAIRPNALLPRPASVNPQPPLPEGSSHNQVLKRLDIVIAMDGVKILNPNPNPGNENDYMEEDEENGEEDEENGESEGMKISEEDEDDEEEAEAEAEDSFWGDDIIEDYFSDKASSSESPGTDDK